MKLKKPKLQWDFNAPLSQTDETGSKQGTKAVNDKANSFQAASSSFKIENKND